jgi:hypothetical protein
MAFYGKIMTGLYNIVTGTYKQSWDFEHFVLQSWDFEHFTLQSWDFEHFILQS